MRSENKSLNIPQNESTSHANSESHFGVVEACEENPLQSLTSASLDHSILCTDVLVQNKKSTENVSNHCDFIIRIEINSYVLRFLCTAFVVKLTNYECTSPTHLGLTLFVTAEC